MENQQTMPVQQPLPNATGVLVLGILSIATCWCYGLPGIVMGIIGLAMSGTANSLLRQNPEGYLPGTVTNMKAGRTCAIIGLCLSAVFIILLIFAIITDEMGSYWYF